MLFHMTRGNPRDRITDPTQLPVQLNTKIPFWLREEVVELSEIHHISQAEIVRKGIETEAKRLRDQANGNFIERSTPTLRKR